MSHPSRPMLDTPYKGLMPYAEEDAPFFFGREPEREIITANLMAWRLTLLYGPSGVGKSSLLRAGVTHHLRQVAEQNLAERGTPEFAVVVFSSCCDDPLPGLIASVEEGVAQALETRFLRETWFLDPASRSLAQALEAATDRLGGDLLIILDQFEEYFLYHPDEDGEGTFAVEFPRAVNRPDLRVSFLIAIREDALSKLDRFKGRIPNLFDNYLRIEHLDREAARAAIEKPIEQYNRLRSSDAPQVRIEPALVEAVLDQVRAGQVVVGEAGRGVVGVVPAEARIETPYLQLVMTRLWDEEMRAESDVLRLGTLERLGGAEQIVRRHLAAAMSALPPREQDAAARVFHHLVTPSGTKIAHTVPDLAEYAELSQQELTPVLDKLSDPAVRILRPVAPPPDRPSEPRYEIFHDVLAPAILDWRARAEGERELFQERRRVTRLRWGLAGLAFVLLAVMALAAFAFQQQAAAQRAQREANAQRAEAVVQRDAAEAARAEAAAERDAAQEARAETAAQRDAAKRAEAEAVAQRDAAEEARAEAQAQQKIALSRELAASALSELPLDYELSILLATEAVSVTHTIQAEDALRELLLAVPLRAVMRGHTDPVVSAVFSPDGRTVASGSCSGGGSPARPCPKPGEVRLWDVTTGRPLGPPLTGHVKGVRSVAFSPDGRALASASDDNTIILWGTSTELSAGVATRQPLGPPLAGHRGRVMDMAFSPDGSTLASGSDDETIILWDVATRQPLGPPLTGHGGWVKSVAFSPDGKTLASASGDTTIRLWDVATRQPIGQPLTGHTDWVNSVAFSPDGKTLASGSDDRTIRLWDVATRQPLGPPLTGHTSYVTSVAFSPDGKTLASGSVDNTIILWDVATRQPMGQPLTGHTGSVNDVAFSPDGQFVVSASDDGTVRVWKASMGPSPTELRGHTGWVTRAAFSPDGKFVVTASNDRTARVWEVSTGQMVAELSGHTFWVNSSAFSPDGRLVVTTSNDSKAWVWEASTGRSLAELRGHTGPVDSAVFSPNGELVVTASRDGTARMWEASTGRSVVELRGHTGPVGSAVFSPDGKFVVTASSDGTARVWEVSSGQVVTELRGHTDWVNSVAFSPNGEFVVTASKDGTARMWEASTGRSVVELRGHTGPVDSAAFSPDGEFVVTASRDGTARVWEASSGQVVTELRGHTDWVNTTAFSPDGELVVTTSNDSTAWVWEVSTGQMVAELRGHTGPVFSAAFSPDGRFVVTAGEDSTARIYPWEMFAPFEDLLPLARTRVTRSLTNEECRQYLHVEECPPTP